MTYYVTVHDLSKKNEENIEAVHNIEKIISKSENITHKIVTKIENIVDIPEEPDNQAIIEHSNKLTTQPNNKYHETSFNIEKGDSITSVMKYIGMPYTEYKPAITSLKTLFNPSDLKIGNEITIQYSQIDEELELLSLTIRTDKIIRYVVTKNEDRTYNAQIAKNALKRKLVRASGKITNSLFQSGRQIGIPAQILMQIINVYSYDIDFQRDIKTGDKIEVMFEQFYTEEDSFVRNGKILYSTLETNGEKYKIYYYRNTAGIDDYYTKDGKTVRKSLLRTPINGARISSGYGLRKHPILGYNKKHKGVDFSAPRGTPIMAAGDGIIDYIGRKGSYGNYIRVKHNGEFKTAYAHLHGFKKGIKKGSRVKQGQIIGYLGSTGRSTGPHLHYEVLKNNTQVNPSKLKLPNQTELAETDFKLFQKHHIKLHKILAALNAQRKEKNFATYSIKNN
jgi:murein DD-endopeptidase MepM/ murein hydrolase activator NlpD